MVIDFKAELIWSIWLGNYRLLGHVKSTSKEHAYTKKLTKGPTLRRFNCGIDNSEGACFGTVINRWIIWDSVIYHWIFNMLQVIKLREVNTFVLQQLGGLTLSCFGITSFNTKSSSIEESLLYWLLISSSLRAMNWGCVIPDGIHLVTPIKLPFQQGNMNEHLLTEFGKRLGVVFYGDFSAFILENLQSYSPNLSWSRIPWTIRKKTINNH